LIVCRRRQRLKALVIANHGGIDPHDLGDGAMADATHITTVNASSPAVNAGGHDDRQCGFGGHSGRRWRRWPRRRNIPMMALSSACQMMTM